MLPGSWSAAVCAELLADGNREAGSPLQQASGSQASAALLAAKPAPSQMPCGVGLNDVLASLSVWMQAFAWLFVVHIPG